MFRFLRRGKSEGPAPLHGSRVGLENDVPLCEACLTQLSDVKTGEPWHLSDCPKLRLV
jgi:hypothetical protein